MVSGGRCVLPQSSIKRLQFAFSALAGLTLLALAVGCVAFAFSYSAQKQLFDETTPLLIDTERLSKVVINFASASRQLETIDNQARLERALARYRAQSDALQAELLKLLDFGLDGGVVGQLNEVVRALDTHERTYVQLLKAKIDAKIERAELRRLVYAEGQILQDRLAPGLLDSSLLLMEASDDPMGEGTGDVASLSKTLNEVQLLTDIGFAAERFQYAVSQNATEAKRMAADASRETLAPAFRGLARLVLKLRDDGKRRVMARSLKVFNDRALGPGGIADQTEKLIDAERQLDVLNRQRASLLSEMNGLIDRIVSNTRDHFLEQVDATRQRSLMAVLALALLSVVAFAAAIWIGWRLINRDIARRLDRLATSTVALASGDLDVAIDQAGNDELAEMARAAETFRHNALELRRAEAELADRLLEVEGANRRLLEVNDAVDKANAELAESELRYQLAVDGSSVGIWDYDVRTGVLYWSNRLKRMLDLPADGAGLDLAYFLERLHPEDRALVKSSRDRHLMQGEAYDVECRLRKEDGGYIWIRNCGQAVSDDTGRPIRMAGSVVDITESKLAEIKLKEYARELERSNQELDQFAYIASHDLKEPLRAIYNHASFLLEDYQGKLDDQGEQRLNRLIKLSKRMEKLIADLLYFSRLGRGDQTMNVLDLNDIVADVEAHLKDTLMSRNARIDVPAALPSIHGHPAHITALFQNLISNGTKYNDADHKVIEIGTAPPDEGQASPLETLYVRDNGIGIDDVFKEEVFRLFKRLNAEKAYGEGTGAGLTFVKKIVENHGGRIWLESTPDTGTTFFFTLKRAA